MQIFAIVNLAVVILIWGFALGTSGSVAVRSGLRPLGCLVLASLNIVLCGLVLAHA